MAKSKRQFRHPVLDDSNAKKTAEVLQSVVVDCINLSLVIKQAHWNVFGPNFRSIHLHLDEIWEDTQAAIDTIAERIVAIGISVDGRTKTISEKSGIVEFPAGFQSVEKVDGLIADALAFISDGLTKAIDDLDEPDPVSQDMLVGIAEVMQKHLWMVQAQEV